MVLWSTCFAMRERGTECKEISAGLFWCAFSTLLSRKGCPFSPSVFEASCSAKAEKGKYFSQLGLEVNLSAKQGHSGHSFSRSPQEFPRCCGVLPHSGESHERGKGRELRLSILKGESGLGELLVRGIEDCRKRSSSVVFNSQTSTMCALYIEL